MAEYELPTLAPDQCPACGAPGALTEFNGSLPLASGRLIVDVPNLQGEQCAHCHEVFLDSESQSRFLAAADDLVLQARKQAGAELRRVRKKLRLTQQQAALLAGDGPNGFSRYEQGHAQPVAAVFNLYQFLDRHPDLLPEILEHSVSVR